MREFLDHQVPSRRWADPTELTAAALLLPGPAASYITGAVLPVDGGWTAHRPGRRRSDRARANRQTWMHATT